MDATQDLDSASLGAVLKTALDAVVVMRLNGTIAGWNDVAEQTFGWSYAEALGQRMSAMIIPHRYRAAHEHGLEHFIATGEGPVLNRRIEIEALHRAGHELPVELSITRTEQFGEPVFLGFLRDISERRDAARRQELMIGELNHRVKNLLGVVAGIAHQTARNTATVPEFSRAFEGRLASLGRAHGILTAAAWEQAPLRALVSELLGAYLDQPGAQISVAGPDILLSPRQLLSLSMILHELLTNAVKYGALSSATGHIDLNWRVEDKGLSITWSEKGISGVEAPSRKGFGSKMIALNVNHDLRGSMSQDWHTAGMQFHLEFGLSEEAA